MFALLRFTGSLRYQHFYGRAEKTRGGKIERDRKPYAFKEENKGRGYLKKEQAGWHMQKAE